MPRVLKDSVLFHAMSHYSAVLLFKSSNMRQIHEVTARQVRSISKQDGIKVMSFISV